MSLWRYAVAAFHAASSHQHTGKHTTGQRARKAQRPFRPNPWLRCGGMRQPPAGQGCGHRVPPSAIHPTCMRAGDYPSLIEAAKTHGGPCCRGECPRCRQCLDRLGAVGWCSRCKTCQRCCPGHGKDGSDETGGN